MIGYPMMCEQAGPSSWVRDVQSAEAAGFDFAVISDHYLPWVDAIGLPRTPGRSWAPRPKSPPGSSS